MPGEFAHQHTDWHYVDCSDGTGTIYDYTHGQAVNWVQQRAFYGGAYAPTLDRIYLAPYRSATGANWHYIDCETNTIVPYTAAALSIVGDRGAYNGAIYVPPQDRVYFIPYGQWEYTPWHYIDCSDGSLQTYTGYEGTWTRWVRGGCYDPKRNRIYMTPAYSYWQLGTDSGQTSFENIYIDCATNTFVTANPTIPTLTSPWPDFDDYYYCSGGVYVPKYDRIYYLPKQSVASSNEQWFYLDIENNAYISYNHGSYYDIGFDGGCYCPLDDRIYLAGPSGPAGAKGIHYINCATNTAHFIQVDNLQTWEPVGFLNQKPFANCSFIPPLNSIILAPALQFDTQRYVPSFKNPSYRTLTTTFPRTATESLFSNLAQGEYGSLLSNS